MLVALLLVLLLGYIQDIRRLDSGGRAVLRDAPNQSIVVLTGGDQRIATGFALLQQGIAPKLFISGVGRGVRLEDILPELSEDIARRVFLGREARDTLGNAEEIAAWLPEVSETGAPLRVVLVSAHYHLPRALWHMSQKMPKVTWIPIAAHPEALPLADWYKSGLGWRIIASELLKLLGSKFMQVLS